MHRVWFEEIVLFPNKESTRISIVEEVTAWQGGEVITRRNQALPFKKKPGKPVDDAPDITVHVLLLVLLCQA
jgi:hypothetical protein